MMIADRMNPIVLKELRQGLKSKAFVASFLGLQVLMVMSMFIFFASVSSNSGDMEFANGFFWFMLGVILMLFMPLRSFGALYGEMKGDTLEMLFLTRMSSWDIAFGKWLALLLQIGLLVCAVLPYLVLRYYLGSVNITADFVQLGLQVVGSSMLVAMGVGLSAWTNKVLRGLLIFFALTSLYGLPLLLFSFTRTGMSAFALWKWWDPVIWFCVLVLIMLYFVEYGASQIAPHAENHSIRKRAFALGVGVVLIPYAIFLEGTIVPLAVGLSLLVPVLIDTLCEPVYHIRSLYRPPRKWRACRLLLFPGWPSSMLFILLMLAAFLGAGFLITKDSEFAIRVLVFLNIVLYPFLFIRLFPRLSKKPILSYILFQVGSLLLFILFAILVETLPGPSVFEWASYAIFPAAGFYEVMDDGIDDFVLGLLILPTLATLSIHLLKAVPLWRAMFRLGKEAEVS